MTADRFPRTVFFGTPDFAAASLRALLGAGVDVPLVVTQPDRPVGRHAELRPSAVAALAASRGIPLEKPETLKANAGFVSRLREARPEAIAVVAYGRILPPEILGLPRLGCINVHASLLPRWRGASPIQAAILAGDAETGVVTMRMEEGLDTGPVYLERRVTIGEHETSGELSGRLQLLGGALLVETLEGLAAGRLSPSPQAGDSTATATVCRPIRREDALVDWERPAAEIVRRLRAFTPWPGLFTFLQGERVKILDADARSEPLAAPPGSFDLAGDLEEDELVAAAGEGTAVRIRRLQRAGRKPVTGAEFARAARLPGRFGTPQ
ncbi:MAG: methionyl-tRNA formyltransferase [Thermoanaerobaculia bacterium]